MGGVMIDTTDAWDNQELGADEKDANHEQPLEMVR